MKQRIKKVRVGGGFQKLTGGEIWKKPAQNCKSPAETMAEGRKKNVRGYEKNW